MKTSITIANLLNKVNPATLFTKGYLGLPFFNRKPKNVCQACGYIKTPAGDLKSSFSNTTLKPNEAYTKTCRFSKKPGCINTNHTSEIAKTHDWQLGPNGQKIDTSIQPWMEKAAEVHIWAVTVYRLNKVFYDNKKQLDLSLEIYIFWTTFLFLVVVVALLTIRLELLSMTNLIP